MPAVILPKNEINERIESILKLGKEHSRINGIVDLYFEYIVKYPSEVKNLKTHFKRRISIFFATKHMVQRKWKKAIK